MLPRWLMAVLVVVGASVLPAQGVELKWKFEKDKPFYQKMTTETNQEMKVMNNPVTQKQKQTFYFVWTPVKQEGDSWVIKQKIEGVMMDITIGSQTINYDSTKSDAKNNPLNDFFNALVNTEFTLTLDTKTMKVTKIEGHKEFLAKLVNVNPTMQSLLNQILSEQALKEMAEPTFAAIPNEDKKEKDTWPKESTLDMGPIGKYINKYTYTLEKADKDKATIKVKTELTYVKPAEGQGMGMGGLPFKIKEANLKGENAGGTIEFDVAKGRIAKSEMALDLKGTLDIEIGGQTTKVELSQHQTSNVETSDTSFKAKTPEEKPNK